MRKFSGLLLISLLVPAFAFAQATSSELQMTIRAALASDPRTNSMSPDALDALAAQLAQGARAKGMTAQDISWKPVESIPVSAAEEPGCSVFPQYFCTISDSFGFGWGDHTIPIWLAVTALMFLFIVGEMRYLHRKHLVEAQARAAVPPFSGVPPSGNNLTP